MWLAFDLGTSGVKAALINSNGKIVRSAVERYPTQITNGGVVEQEASDWWHALVAAACVGGAEVAKIVLTGQMQDLILLNERGEPLRPAILYSDMRAQAEAAEIIERVGKERLIALTGNDQSADSLWAKVLWLKRNQLDLLSRAKILLFSPADYAAYKMTGNAVTDTTTASTTGLMILRGRCWLDGATLAEFGIGEVGSRLPPLAAGGAQVGRLTPNAAAELGLQPNIPVYHAAGDAGAATLGAGSGEIGQAYGYLGTSGWIAFSAAQPGSSEQGVFTLAHPRPDQYIHVAPLLTAGGNLDWVRDLFGEADYDGLIGAALERPIAHILYLPYLGGERAPFSDPFARAAFIGMSRNTERTDMCRAALEGVAYAYVHALDTLLPERPETFVLTGGGTRSNAWCQLFADVLGQPVSIAEDAENVGIRGALLAARFASGGLDSYAPAGYFPIRNIVTPNPDLVARYAQKYAVFRAAYPALKPIFAALARKSRAP
jgi:xylulokinase